MKIDHIALYVADLEAARGFFERFFGATAGPEYHNPATGLRTYFLSFGGGARLELMTRPGLAATPGCDLRMGYAHVAFAVGSRERVDSLTRELQQAGCTVVSGPRVTGDGYYESCVEGPGGCLVEITE